MMSLPSIPRSWSSLSWQQLCKMWTVKQRYGGNADVARAAALLVLTAGSGFKVQGPMVDEHTGESVYTVTGTDGRLWTVTARELAHMAKQALPWFDYPYGDPGQEEEKDDKGVVVREKREAVKGYVSPMRDAMILPEETVRVGRRHFALPQVAMSNMTWQQYRSLQGIVPQLFAEGVGEEQALQLDAQFLAHALVPRSIALLDTSGGSIRLRPHYEYRYNKVQAEQELEKWWARRLKREDSTLFHIVFQVYQTSVAYYSTVYHLLFQDSGKSDPLRDALTGEVGTINTIMKYAGYAEQQQVYDSDIPFVFDILNTMTKEAKEIEKMNAKIKKK